MKTKMFYVAKPRVIEAYQVGGIVPFRKLANWCGGAVVKNGNKIIAITVKGDWARIGDWICLHEDGKFFRLSNAEFNDVFETK